MSIWATVFAERYDDAIAHLEDLVRRCPDRHWSDAVWTVHRSDRHVWPIVRGMGADLPDDERLQLQAAFWNVVVHALHALDDYLEGGTHAVAHPAPFDGWQMPGHVLPDAPPTRGEILGYAAQLREKARDTLASLTDDDVVRPARRGRPFGDLLVHELVHLAEHNAQLELFLNTKAGWSHPAWSVSDRWFQPCEDCDPFVQVKA